VYPSGIGERVWDLTSRSFALGRRFRPLRKAGRILFRLTGYRSFVQSDSYLWYRWHPDAVIGFNSRWEEPLSRELLRPGGCFVDVGSHVGRWAIRASAFYRRVVAFEPDPFTNYVLRRNISRNHIRNIQPFAVALSDHRSDGMLFSYGAPACNSLRANHVSGARRGAGRRVKVRLLDDFTSHFLRPMLLKIDVEGEELRVLKGGNVTLENFRPTLVVEVHFRNEIESVMEEMKKHEYFVTEMFQDPTNPQGQVYLVGVCENRNGRRTLGLD
jgi:FkbM family methyltransferase